MKTVGQGFIEGEHAVHVQSKSLPTFLLANHFRFTVDRRPPTASGLFQRHELTGAGVCGGGRRAVRSYLL